MGVRVLTAFCKGSQYRIQLFNLLLRYFQFARDCKNLGHFQKVKFCCCYCTVLAAFGVSNPSICRAFLPTLTFQVECGTPAVLVELKFKSRSLSTTHQENGRSEAEG
jgi:hypothetical protein